MKCEFCEDEATTTIKTTDDIKDNIGYNAQVCEFCKENILKYNY